MLSQEALERILGIKEKTVLSPEDMPAKLQLTFYPTSAEVPSDVRHFIDELMKLFAELGVKIVPYDEALVRIPIYRVLKRAALLLGNNALYVGEKLFGKSSDRIYVSQEAFRKMLRRTRVKSGISIIHVPGANESLPIDNVSSFKKSSVITIRSKPSHISRDTPFHVHFDTAMSFFAEYMTNIVILVSGTEWILYNFNASHPFYDMRSNFKHDVMYGLIPKIVAPIRPLRLTEFEPVKEGFDIRSTDHNQVVYDISTNGRLFEQTNLYPPGKKIDDLPFKTEFHRLVGKLHLDNRNGMSYGFLARQMPTRLSKVLEYEVAKEKFGSVVVEEKDYFTSNGNLYVTVEFIGKRYCLRVPEVWVMTQRSGANKTKINPEKDLLKLGLKDGRLYLQAPAGLRMQASYKPSFDTTVILAHAVGNALLASLFAHINPSDQFAKRLSEKGMALVHWHGYINPNLVPKGWVVYGLENPHVSCSSPQAAVYALHGKLFNARAARERGLEYRGDIHIEPHHGTNMTYESIEGIASLFLENEDMAVLGNKYLDQYQKQPS